MNYSGDILREYLAKEEVADIMYTFVDEEKQLRMLLAREREEGEGLFPELAQRLLELGRDDDLMKASADREFRYELYREFGIGLDNGLSLADNDDPGLNQDNDPSLADSNATDFAGNNNDAK